MNLAVLFSGGKDSVFSTYLSKKEGHKISCLISIFSENKESYMFHTPSISKVKKQSQVMEVPLLIKETKGEKEEELEDLKKAIEEAKEKYSIEGIVTGAVESVYQSSRIKKICDELDLICINPLWKKNQIKLLEELIENDFKVIITGVFAYPLDKTWLGREINENFLEDVKEMNEKYKISPAGEGGEFESFVLNSPLFKKSLNIQNKEILKEGENSWRMEIELDDILKKD